MSVHATSSGLSAAQVPPSLMTPAPSLRAVWLASRALPGGTSEVSLADGTRLALDAVAPERAREYLTRASEDALVVAFLDEPADGQPSAPLRLLRDDPRFERTRIFLLGTSPRLLSAGGLGDLDVEAVIDAESLGAGGLARAVEQGLRAHRALGSNPLIPRFYLNATFNKVFDWFENTRWTWSDLGDFSKVDRSLLSDEEIELLKESAIIEFGTLPGAHNFLREWGDEYSFSSWALSWGAEESRHSLVQCRYLEALGISVPAKHAMYKREPYPMGKDRAGTLMMNIISEARAAEYYKTLASQTREPVLRDIWTILGRDEGRHARAFLVFCKELCELDRSHLNAALRMAYVWLADRSDGVKHPAGHFYPHSTSATGLRQVEKSHQGVTDRADARVFAMLRGLTGDAGLRTVKDLKRTLRELV
ncbi:ferritin-like domain-containing protein [Pyxidicoccus fallax]|uniref:Ferritin-like domain-containing protein n=1 Tax=Pyxidicoccus fallax TaxID=394095 RepID=A0A848LFW9_9BACT|nr:ferritin-like domain-containing protein [Pyxidicoccus fallax]NMO17322.1 ferritin-like domain-containing protein [Pyxidicoccus fallax]NPC78959.1 ferritin-like domain-containing protein [Pyxidicoccus fallax]